MCVLCCYTCIYKSLHCIVTMKIAMTPNKHRVSYMSAHVLLNLLNEKGKGIKMRGLLSILSLFHKECNKFNNTGPRMLDSIYHST